LAGGAIAVGFAFVLRGPGGGPHGRAAAQGLLGHRDGPRPAAAGLSPPPSAGGEPAGEHHPGETGPAAG
jgi:aquaporin Z